MKQSWTIMYKANVIEFVSLGWRGTELYANGILQDKEKKTFSNIRLKGKIDNEEITATLEKRAFTNKIQIKKTNQILSENIVNNGTIEYAIGLFFTLAIEKIAQIYILIKLIL